MSLPILPTISTSCIVISAILVAIGWWQIAHRHVNTHKNYVMGSIFRINVFIIYATRTIFIGNTDFGGPDSVRTYYKIFLIFHINLATIGGVLGLVQIITAFKDKFKWHRRIGPVASIIWFFTGITGVAVYLLLYVIYPGGETTSVIKATLGL